MPSNKCCETCRYMNLLSEVTPCADCRCYALWEPALPASAKRDRNSEDPAVRRRCAECRHEAVVSDAPPCLGCFGTEGKAAWAPAALVLAMRDVISNDPAVRRQCAECEHIEIACEDPPCLGCYGTDAKAAWAPKVVGDADARTCATCRHGNKDSTESPCDACFDDSEGRRPQWEPVGAIDSGVSASADTTNPAHYRQFPVEVIQICRHLNFNRGNVVKYCCRAGAKDDEIQDLKKARWYIDDEIQRLTGEGEHAKP